MGQALYRKYRPKGLSEVVGQEHITTTLVKALKSGRISHAYLFSGPRGVGKTSIARILAHEINGLPYTDDSTHLDIIEIDAASNRRIDEIRDLRDKVYIAPTSGKYKVYIIDEVHMLTREAFNALLKTLEEPPAHAVFILATTEAHKLPDTIISRTQHYTFKPVEKKKVIEHLAHIAKKEGIDITKDALGLLAAHGGGSFRDSISLLDQAGGIENKIDADEVRRLLGIAPDSAIEELIAVISQSGQAAQILAKLGELYGQGLHGASIASQLAGRLRSALAEGKPVLAVDTSLKLLRELIEVPASHNPERLLEIILIDASDNSTLPIAAVAVTSAVAAPSIAAQVSEPVQTAAAPATSNPPKPVVEQPAPPSVRKPAVTPPEDPTPVSAPDFEPVPGVNRALDETVWPEVLNNLKKQYNTLYGVLRMANPVFGGEEIELQLKFAFHQKRLNEAKNREIIAGCIRQVTGRTINVKCTVNKDAVPAPVSTPTAVNTTPQASAELGSITDIFGGGEVINS